MGGVYYTARLWDYVGVVWGYSIHNLVFGGDMVAVVAGCQPTERPGLLPEYPERPP